MCWLIRAVLKAFRLVWSTTTWGSLFPNTTVAGKKLFWKMVIRAHIWLRHWLCPLLDLALIRGGSYWFYINKVVDYPKKLGCSGVPYITIRF